jgi:5'-3' exonuclease
MKKNNCTLICDGNWLLVSRFSVINGGFEKNLSEAVKKQSQLELEELMAKSINIVINRFQDIDNIILVTDGGSWRKQLSVPDCLQDIVYKGNRTQDKELDWSYIYGALNNLADRCKDIGITVSNHSSIEGDDWIWYWSRKLNSEGTSCIIWSSDNDLKQLVQTDKETLAFTAWFNDKNGIFFDNYYDDDIYEFDLIDFFMKPTKLFSQIFESVKSTVNHTYINPDNIVMEKIICGDAGDNIQSVAIVKSNNKNFRVTQKMWNEIKENLHINNLTDFFNKTQKIAHNITNINKFSGYEVNNILTMIEYNKKLVWLNEQIIPDTIVLYMNQCEYKLFDINYMRSNFKVLCDNTVNTNIEDIFESIF